jgi:hypothetical protein
MQRFCTIPEGMQKKAPESRHDPVGAGGPQAQVLVADMLT